MRLPALLLVVALGGCSCAREQPLPDDPTDNTSDIATVNASAEVIAPPPPVALNVTNDVAPAAPPPVFEQDEQMRDDADATGMTARLPDDAAPAESDNATRPAETTEQR